MAQDWRAGFKQAVIDAIVAKGALVRDGAERYSYNWEDYAGTEPARTEIIRRGINYQASTYDDKLWHEFVGTFAEQPWSDVTGIEAVIVGRGAKPRSYRFRVKMGLGSFIQAVIHQADKQED
jgi:hypothetical protein